MRLLQPLLLCPPAGGVQSILQPAAQPLPHPVLLNMPGTWLLLLLLLLAACWCSCRARVLLLDSSIVVTWGCFVLLDGLPSIAVLLMAAVVTWW